MSVTEILLIIIGGIIVVLSYVLPNQKDSKAESTSAIDEEQIKVLVEKEITDAKRHINDIVDETVTYSVEKTERAMERLTNEKIMAVNEYSDSVLEEINKNHNEVIFLYDMLNDKHNNLVSTVSEATKTAKNIQQKVHDAETTKVISEESDETKGAKPEEVKEEKAEEFIPILPQVMEATTKNDINNVKIIENTAKEINVEEISNEEKNGNNNEKILKLHKLGKSNIVIAKELELGVGEVKLVIDLFEKDKFGYNG